MKQEMTLYVFISPWFTLSTHPAKLMVLFRKSLPHGQDSFRKRFVRLIPGKRERVAPHTSKPGEQGSVAYFVLCQGIPFLSCWISRLCTINIQWDFWDPSLTQRVLCQMALHVQICFFTPFRRKIYIYVCLASPEWYCFTWWEREWLLRFLEKRPTRNEVSCTNSKYILLSEFD